ncbi:MAG: hypothetical protein JOY54_05780 [Acidobacteriaceae bacterium]|nr:hypothetical protein [Acidobacteriaceae bacterium]
MQPPKPPPVKRAPCIYCLFAREETDIRPLLRNKGADEALEAVIRSTVWQKWVGHEINRASFAPPQRPMYSIGG